MATLAIPAVETQPMFDPRSRLVYAVMLAELLLAVPLFWLTGFSIADPWAFLPPLWGGLLILSGWLARRVGHPAVGGACETVALIYFQGMVAVLLLFPLTAISAPLADGFLAAADRFIGFHWPLLASALQGWETPLRLLYRSFLWQPVVLLVALFATGRGDRAWRVVSAAAVSLAICVAIYPLAPALGPAVHYGVAPIAGLHVPWEFAPVIESIKGGGRVASTDMVVGIVSFPSYHAAAAVIFAYGAWPTKLRWPLLILNFGMAFSAIVAGGHYMVDIFAGVGVAGLALIMARRANMASTPGSMRQMP